MQAHCLQSSFVDLQLVLLYLLLHALVGLVVLDHLEDQLFEPMFILVQRLDCLHVSFLLTIQLCFYLSLREEESDVTERACYFSNSNSLALDGKTMPTMSTFCPEVSR